MATTDGRRTVVITGASQGLGFFAALSLAQHRPDWHLILACRSPLDRANAAAQEIRTQTKHEHVEVMELDLASFDSTRTFAAALLKRLNINSSKSSKKKKFETDSQALPPMAALVCNAGAQFVNNQKTVDNIESTFGTNHLGHFLLVNLILNHIIDSKENVRIINVASDTHNPEEKTGMPDPRIPPQMIALAYPERDNDPTRPKEDAAAAGRRNYTYGATTTLIRFLPPQFLTSRAFCCRTSKLCNVLFTYALERKLRKLQINHVEVCAYNPGFMPGTGLARDYPAILRWAWHRILPLIGRIRKWHRPEGSGRNLAELVFDCERFQDVNGKYFNPGPQEKPSSTDSYKKTLQNELWNLSAALTKLTPEETPFKIQNYPI